MDHVPLTVCVLAEMLDDPSGVARASADLAAGLAAAGHRVFAVTSQVRAEVEGATVVPVPVPPLVGPLAGRPGADALARAAAMHRAVVRLSEGEGVHAAIAPLGFGLGAVCVLDRRFPTLITCMTTSATVRALRPDGAASESELAMLAIERAVMRRARYLHGLSDAGLRRALADYPEHAHDEAVVVGRGLRDRTGPVPPPANRQPRILFVGRIEQRKGVDVLLAAARRLRDMGVDFDLTLIGPERSDAVMESGRSPREEIEQAGDEWLHDRVHFAGVVEDDELDRQYRAADVVVTAARFESHGVVLVEAMMYGRPIVATRVGGIPEVVEEDGNALLVEPDDADALAGALARVLGDRPRRERMGARSRELFEDRFEAGAVAERMAGHLARLADRHERGTAEPQHEGDVAEPLHERLAGLVADAFAASPDAARATAAELLEPPAAAWHALALELERERSVLDSELRRVRRDAVTTSSRSAGR